MPCFQSLVLLKFVVNTKYNNQVVASVFFIFKPTSLQQREDIHEKISESEKLMQEMSQTWEQKLEKTGWTENSFIYKT